MITGSIHHKNFRPLILSRMIYLIIGLCLLVGGGRSAALGQAAQKETAKAQSSMDRGLQSFRRGDMDQALADWKEATEFFAKGGNTKGQIEALTRLALAQQNLGRYTQALQSLNWPWRWPNKQGIPPPWPPCTGVWAALTWRRGTKTELPST